MGAGGRIVTGRLRRGGADADFQPLPGAAPVARRIVPKGPVGEDPTIWQPGHWDWVGAGYEWRPGRYVGLAGHGPKWLYGYWSNRDGAWIWVPAHWV